MQRVRTEKAMDSSYLGLKLPDKLILMPTHNIQSIEIMPPHKMMNVVNDATLIDEYDNRQHFAHGVATPGSSGAASAGGPGRDAVARQGGWSITDHIFDSGGLTSWLKRAGPEKPRFRLSSRRGAAFAGG